MTAGGHPTVGPTVDISIQSPLWNGSQFRSDGAPRDRGRRARPTRRTPNFPSC